MGILNEPMKQVVREQRLGYIATVCEDGTPNLSPKGTIKVWDDDHLVFADICSPGTVENLRSNPAIEINMVDPFLRKGYRFKGTATIVSQGHQFDDVMKIYDRDGQGVQSRVANQIRSFVLVKVDRALPVISPGYTGDVTEEQMRGRWEEYYASLKPRSKV